MHYLNNRSTVFIYLLLTIILFFNTIKHNVFALQTAGDTNTPSYYLFPNIVLNTKHSSRYINKNIYINVISPQLEGLNNNANHPHIKQFNQLINDLVKNERQRFMAQVNQANLNAQPLPSKLNSARLYIDYNSSIIKIQQHPIISVQFILEGMVGRMAHPYHYHLSINYDLKTGQLITFNDLFNHDGEFLHYFSQYTNTALSKRLNNSWLINQGTAPLITNFKNWNMMQDGILITFDEYQVAAYALGAQKILIPWSTLKTVLSQHAPFNQCAKRKHCAFNILLTGGFTESPINTQDRILDPSFRFNQYLFR